MTTRSAFGAGILVGELLLAGFVVGGKGLARVLHWWAQR